MADEPLEPGPHGRQEDGRDDRTLPDAPLDGTLRDLGDTEGDDGPEGIHEVRQDDKWSARASVPSRPVPSASDPRSWMGQAWDEGGQGLGRWWMPLVVGVVAVLLLSGLAVGVWLIAAASDDEPAPVSPTAPAPGEPRETRPTATARPMTTGPEATEPETTEPTLVEVPDLVGAPLVEAQIELDRLGLAYQVLYQPEGPEPGVVLATYPDAGSRVAASTEVTLVVASAPEDTEAPGTEPPAGPP